MTAVEVNAIVIIVGKQLLQSLGALILSRAKSIVVKFCALQSLTQTHIRTNKTEPFVNHSITCLPNYILAQIKLFNLSKQYSEEVKLCLPNFCGVRLDRRT